MPKRSNEFQRLVHLIFEHLAPSAKVQESAFVRETGLATPTDREVDILVEDEVAGVPRRMAVECRDRGRKDAVEWIDCLIGKYFYLPVDKIVAVSKSGLTRAAVEKARARNIEVRTLQEALAADWQKEFVDLAPGAVALHTSDVKIGVIAEPPLPENFDPKSFTCFQDGVSVGSLEEAIQRLVRQEAGRFFREEFGKTYKTVADLKQPVVLTFESRPPRDVILKDADSSSYSMQGLAVEFRLNIKLSKGRVDYFRLGNAGVSVGTVQLSSGKVFKVSSVQVPGDQHARVKIEQGQPECGTTPRSTGRKPLRRAPSG